MTTRTKQLAWRRLPNGDTTVYTCPSGHRTIIKDVRIYNNGATTKHTNCYVANSAKTVYGHVVPYQNIAAAGMATPTQTWAVMEAGQELVVYWEGTSNDADCIISGAELSV